MARPNAPDRFNEEKATYVMRGGDGEGDQPDLERGAEAIRSVVRKLPARPGVYRMLDARGDAQFALGDRAKAREAYLKALALVDVGDPQHRLLTLKLIEAGGTPPHSEDKT